MADVEAPTGHPGLDYAQRNLEVNKVYAEAQEAREELVRDQAKLAQGREIKRDLEFRLRDREMEITSDERGKHPEMSQAAMDRHLKTAFHADDSYRELKEQLDRAGLAVWQVEQDIDLDHADIRIATARLTELGGYLNYLAALKQHETLTSADAKQETS
jgi:hypothetical protein